jgi:uncharacterized protein (TIGR02246 family)
MPRFGWEQTVTALLVFSLVLSLNAVVSASDECLSGSDRDAITKLNETYRQAWLANDAAAVRRTFTQDAVLLPHHGLDPVVGMTAINQFWWPVDAPATTITRFETTYDEIGGCGPIAFVRGKSRVEWTVDEKSGKTKFSNAGTYLTLMRKTPDGTWKITHQMWDDPPNQRR